MERSTPFLEALTLEADHAQAAEAAYRREAAKRTKQLASDRAFAFRRLHLMRAITSAAADAESEEVAVSVATAGLRARLGWTHDSEARDAVLSNFAAVAQAVYAGLSPTNDTEPTGRDVLEALADFEDWYAQGHPSPFWVLFENEMRESPVVDF
jgi:hypothetical protein